MIFEPEKLQAMASQPKEGDPEKSPSIRRRIAENLDKIEAAKANGYSLSEIAAALGLVGKTPAATLSAYLSSIRRSSVKRAAKAAARGHQAAAAPQSSSMPGPPKAAAKAAGLPPLPSLGPPSSAGDAWAKIKPLKKGSTDE